MSIISSSIASLLASIIYFVSSFIFDKQLSAKLSNIISSILSVSVDVILQSYFFKKPQLLKNKTFLAKAFVFEMFTVYFNQLLFSKTYKYAKEKNLKIKTIYIRLFVSIILFLIYTYPVRKFILFS
jgi:hypothetical protein